MGNICRYCLSKIASDSLRSFCDVTCQNNYQFEKYIKAWKNGENSGTRGKLTFNLSAHLIRYIHEKYNHKCARCSWSEVNTYTHKIPLEIEHIDGNSLNNSEINLILLCPNCHSLTKTYKNANKGHGRVWRREKYAKIDDVPL